MQILTWFDIRGFPIFLLSNCSIWQTTGHLVEKILFRIPSNPCFIWTCCHIPNLGDFLFKIVFLKYDQNKIYENHRVRLVNFLVTRHLCFSKIWSNNCNEIDHFRIAFGPCDGSFKFQVSTYLKLMNSLQCSKISIACVVLCHNIRFIHINHIDLYYSNYNNYILH